MNEKEQRCFDALTRSGYTVLRRGWPDFLVISPDRQRGFAIEFKATGDHLSDDQIKMHSVLAQLGLLVRVWKEPDLKEFRAGRRYGRVFLFPENLQDASRRVRELEVQQLELQDRINAMRRTLDESCTAVEKAYESAIPPINGNGA